MSRRSSNKVVKSGSTVDNEVNTLFNLKDKNQFTNALLALRKKYHNDEELVNKIQEVFVNKQSSIIKSAKKFAEAIRKRYGNTNLPYHQLLSKARAHGKKHDLSEAEFAEFQRIYEQEISGTAQRNEVVVPLTNLMKVLGNVAEGMDHYFNINENDYRNLEEILKLHEMSRPLHAQVLLQSIQYEDLALYSTSGTIDPSRQNPGEHVHPVVAAMFLPSIPTLNSHFLYSNMAGIVKSRYNGEPLTTRPDYELFYNLVTDPNDVVCDNRTPISDLLHRCNLQNQLWNSVLSLRNGQYYNTSFREFVTSVDVCRLNKYDNPDLLYGRHDGTIIKRLMAAFSFRPTVVTTLPLTYVFANNPYAQNVRPTVTSIPMINVRLHNWVNATSSSVFGGSVTTAAAGNIKLSDTLTQAQTFIEGNQLVQRVSDVIYSREILVFYVDRRAHILQHANQAYNLTRLPTAIAGFERINKQAISFEPIIAVRPRDPKPDVFCIRAVVVAEVNDTSNTKTNDPRSLVIGSSTFLFNGKDVLDASGNPTYNDDGTKKKVCMDATSAWPYKFSSDDVFHYSPMDALKRANKEGMYKVPIATGMGTVTPPGYKNLDDVVNIIQEQGIVFIYQNYDSKASEERMLAY